MKPENIKSVDLRYVRGKRTSKILFDNSWILLQDLKVTLSNGETIIVPKGFETDLSSIPEFMWGWMKPFGDFIVAPIVHDWMYRTDYKAKELGWKKAQKFADDEMYYISKVTNNKKWHQRLDNWLRWKGVRLFGAKTYRK